MDTCNTCRHARPRDDGILQCRRYPPVSVTTAAQFWDYPRVLTHDWCGEWAAIHDAEPSASSEPQGKGTGELKWSWHPSTDLWLAESKTGANWHVRWIEGTWRWARSCNDWWEEEVFTDADGAKAACQWKESFLLKEQVK